MPGVSPTTPPDRPLGRRAIVALVGLLAVVALVAGACTGGEGSEAGRGPGTVDDPRFTGPGPGRTYPPVRMADLDALIADRSASGALEGATLLVHQDGSLLHASTVGAVLPVSAVPLAETGWWLVSATLMTLVEDGLVALDEPVSARLPWFGGDKAATTLRHLLSHTSGLPAEVDGGCATVEACDTAIAATELVDDPGDELVVSPLGYHVAARLAETATGQPWGDLVEARLLGPLGMAGTSFRTPPATADDEPGPPPAIDVAPGLLAADGTTTAEDLGRFLTMVLARGEAPLAPGGRVLGAAAFDELERDQTARIDTSDEAWVAATGVPTYGLGVWRDRLRGDQSGLASAVSAPNQLGTFALVDRARGAWAVLVIVDVEEDPLEAVEDSARVAMLLAPAIDGTGRPPGAPPTTVPPATQPTAPDTAAPDHVGGLGAPAEPGSPGA